MKEIDIGLLSKKTGLSTATIRFYESKGLIQSIGRKGLRRQYTKKVIQTISLIKIMRKGGLSLKEIKQLFIFESRMIVNRNLIDGQCQHISQKIDQLQKLDKILQHIKHCPYEQHLSCPDFIKMLESVEHIEDQLSQDLT